jgi:hypothetical protein
VRQATRVVEIRLFVLHPTLKMETIRSSEMPITTHHISEDSVLQTVSLLPSCRDSAVGIAEGYGLNGTSSVPASARSPDRPWDQPSLLSNMQKWLFLSDREVKLPTHIHLAPRSRMAELYL